VVGYYASSLLLSYTKVLVFSHSDKEFPRLPDFELIDGELREEAIRVLTYIDLGKRVKPQVQEREKAQPDKPPSYVLRFTFIGEKRRYAIINDMLVNEGHTLPSGEKVVKITRKRVLLRGRWGERWISISD
jgi:hypothetical protein